VPLVIAVIFVVGFRFSSRKPNRILSLCLVGGWSRHTTHSLDNV